VRPSWLDKQQQQQQQQKVVLTPELTANLIALLQQPDLLVNSSSSSSSSSSEDDSDASSSSAVSVQKLSALTAGAPAVAQLLYELVLASRNITRTTCRLISYTRRAITMLACYIGTVR
jgi:hypothetical protein